jgi:hypothetical protein
MSSPPDAESSSPAGAVTPKVIYVMGAGKSGSTILGVTLGNCEDVVYTGELYSWLMRSGVPVFGGSERGRFWSAVHEDVPDASDLYGSEVMRCLERSLSLFRLSMWPARRRLRPRYRRVALDLYRAIARTAAVTHVVDTSHFPLRARELRKVEGIDLYVVLLIRDPRSVVKSYVRHVDQGAVRRALAVLNTNMDLWLTYLLSLLVFASHRRDRRMLLRYEQFVADPDGMLRDMLERMDVPSVLPDLTQLRTGFPLQGNTLLRADVVALKAGAEPPPSGWLLTRLLQLPWTLLLPRLRPAVSASSSTAAGGVSRTSEHAASEAG